jgi:hypothetical protein
MTAQAMERTVFMHVRRTKMPECGHKRGAVRRTASHVQARRMPRERPTSALREPCDSLAVFNDPIRCYPSHQYLAGPPREIYKKACSSTKLNISLDNVMLLKFRNVLIKLEPGRSGEFNVSINGALTHQYGLHKY